MINSYIDILQVSGKGDTTIQNYRYQLTRFLNWLLQTTGSMEITEITVQTVMGYRDFLLDERLKPHSVNSALTVISAFCKWLTEEGFIHHNPVDEVERVRWNPGPPRWLHPDERFRVVRAAQASTERNSSIIATFLLSGILVSELINLSPDDVVIGKTKGSLVIRSGKRRVVPIPKDLRILLSQYLVSREVLLNAFLFQSQRNEQLTEKGVQVICAEIGERAGVPDLTPSILRHTFAHDLIEEGVSVKIVASLLGVSKLSRMEQYKNTDKHMD